MLVKGKQIKSIGAAQVDTTNEKQFISSEQLGKLEGIAEEANKYVHPDHHEAEMILQNELHRFVTDEQIELFLDKYSKTEIDNLLSDLESGIEWKPSVATFADLATVYPEPSHNTVVIVDEDNKVYRYESSTNNWEKLPILAYHKATSEEEGLMSKEDKVKLDALYATFVNTFVITVTEQGVTSIPTGITTNGTGDKFTKNLVIQLMVNGIMAAPGSDKDYTLTEDENKQIIIEWTNRKFELDVDEELIISYNQIV